MNLFKRLFRRTDRTATGKIDAKDRAEIERTRRNAELAETEGRLGIGLGGMHYDDSEFRKPR